jgi:hypothetical protein
MRNNHSRDVNLQEGLGFAALWLVWMASIWILGWLQ